VKTNQGMQNKAGKENSFYLQKSKRLYRRLLPHKSKKANAGRKPRARVFKAKASNLIKKPWKGGLFLEKKVCLNKGICISEKSLIAIVFAAIVIIAVGASYAVTTEKNSPGYDTGPLKQFLQSFDKFTIAIVLIIGAFILWISARAYQKTQSQKFMLIMFAFALLVLEWVLKLIDRYYIPGQLLVDPVENLIELVVVAFLALGIFFRK